MPNKVLILSASAGAGHVRAAQALERAFAVAGGAGDVRHVDALQLTNKVFRTIYSKTYVEMVDKAPEVLGWLYDALDSPWRKSAATAWTSTPAVVKMLAREQRIASCARTFSGRVVSWRRRSSAGVPQTIVVTPSTCMRWARINTSTTRGARRDAPRT